MTRFPLLVGNDQQRMLRVWYLFKIPQLTYQSTHGAHKSNKAAPSIMTLVIGSSTVNAAADFAAEPLLVALLLLPEVPLPELITL